MTENSPSELARAQQFIDEDFAEILEDVDRACAPVIGRDANADILGSDTATGNESASGNEDVGPGTSDQGTSDQGTSDPGTTDKDSAGGSETANDAEHGAEREDEATTAVPGVRVLVPGVPWDQFLVFLQRFYKGFLISSEN